MNECALREGERKKRREWFVFKIWKKKQTQSGFFLAGYIQKQKANQNHLLETKTESFFFFNFTLKSEVGITSVERFFFATDESKKKNQGEFCVDIKLNGQEK